MRQKKVGVMGAGMMGAEISLCFALAGLEVVLCDVSPEQLEQAGRRQERILERKVGKAEITEEGRRQVLGRICRTQKTEEVGGCDMVLEAIVENLEAKKGLFAELEKICGEDTLFATNTSSLSVTAIAAGVMPPARRRFIGLHFFSPATRMPLVEIVPGYETAPETVEAAKQVIDLIGKEFIVTKDVCGFVVNRMLNIFFIEAIRLVEEGVATPEDIDKACRLGLSHPVGPLALLDLTSLDLNLSVHSSLFQEYGERFRPRPLLKKMVAAGKYGKKSGEGFFQY